MKRACIICDNYKIRLFKANLAKIGFKDITVSPFIKGTSKLEFFFLEKELDKIAEEVSKIESYCKSYSQN